MCRDKAAQSPTSTTWSDVSLTWLFPGHSGRVSSPGAQHGTYQDKTALQTTLQIACVYGECILNLNIGYTCKCGTMTGSPLFHIW